MKKVKAKYISNGTIQEGTLIETQKDINTALKELLIHPLSVKGIQDYIRKNKPVYVNQKGGYCEAKGVWEILEVIS